MLFDTENAVEKLIEVISSIEQVRSIGISGSAKTLPERGEGDVDIFIYCSGIPTKEVRRASILKMGSEVEEYNINAIEGGHWGTGDFALVGGTETWMMYFTQTEVSEEIDAILAGEYPDRADNYYYPVGRLAMLQNIRIVYDESGFLTEVKTRLSVYPKKLREKLVRYHMQALEDTEDLERALKRNDVLFFHFALDIALDHFLQALFALNHRFFPSRKRSAEHIFSFEHKPQDCASRLLDIIEKGASAKTLERSYLLWRCLLDELKILAERISSYTVMPK